MMDAVKFLKEWKRMCDEHEDSCIGCPLFTDNICLGRNLEKGCEEEIVLRVEKWSAEHPQKTRLQDFFERVPFARKKEDGTPFFHPIHAGYCKERFCANCQYAEESSAYCWNLPLEE